MQLNIVTFLEPNGILQFNTGSADFSNYVFKGTNRVFFVVETCVVCFVGVC